MSDLLVTEKAVRPVSAGSNACTYCREAVGTPHKTTCVCVKRKVLVRATLEYEIDVPAEWDPSLIEFSRNDGSWCASNMIGELEALDEDGCLCDRVQFEYLRHTSEPFVGEG